MAPVPPAGALVATVGDLTCAVTQLTEKLDEQKRWTQAELDLFRQKQTDYSERADETLKTVQTTVDAHSADIADLKTTRVSLTDFKQQVATIEMNAQTAHGALKEAIEKSREESKKSYWAAEQNFTTKLDVAENLISAVRDAMHEIHSETIPDLRKQLEDERTKRRSEDLRLERQDEALRDQFDRRCEEIIALLRKDIDNTLTKLKNDYPSKDELESLLREFEALKTSTITQLSSTDDLVDGLREAVKSHREATTISSDQTAKDIAGLVNESSQLKADLESLTQNSTGDLKRLRETFKENIAHLRRDVSEARAAAAQAAVSNEKSIQVVAAEIKPLKEARHVLFDKLKIKDIAGLVRDWDVGHIPTTTARLTDIEARVSRIKTDLETEHESIAEVQRNVHLVKGHFKKFHAIASGLDMDSDAPGVQLGDETPVTAVPASVPIPSILSSSSHALPPINLPKPLVKRFGDPILPVQSVNWKATV